MDIHVKILFDEYGTREYVFYKTGGFAKPVMILTEGYAEKLFSALEAAINHPPCRVRTVEYLNEFLKSNEEIIASTK